MKDKSDLSHKPSPPKYKTSLRSFRDLAFVLAMSLFVTCCYVGYDLGIEARRAAPQEWVEVVKEHLRHHEGLELEPYQDKYGTWTIGYGHTDSVAKKSTRITKGIAEKLLDNDVRDVVMIAQSHPCWPKGPDGVRKGVLVNLFFNLGSGMWEFEDFKMYCRRGQYTKSAMALLDSAYARQVGGRAQFLAEAWATGEWPEEHDGDYKL